MGGVSIYTAAAIAKANPNKTGFTAFRMGLVAYIIPFIFLLNPAILMSGGTAEVALAVVTSVIGVFCLTGAIEGYMFMYWSVAGRVLLAAAAVCMMIPGTMTDIAGVAMVAVAFLADKPIFKPKGAAPVKAEDGADAEGGEGESGEGEGSEGESGEGEGSEGESGEGEGGEGEGSEGESDKGESGTA